MERASVEERKHYPTVCTPTYMAMKNNPSGRRVMGMLLFAIFVLTVIFLLFGIFSLFSRPMIPWMRGLTLAGLGFGVFSVLVAMFLVDILGSIESNLSKIEEHTRLAEKNTYNTSVALAKSMSKK